MNFKSGYTVKAVGYWSVWDFCCTGRGTSGIFQVEQEASHWAIGRVCRWVFGTAIVSRLRLEVSVLCVIATTEKQLRPSRALQPTVRWCLGVTSQEQGHKVPPVGIKLCWGWTTLLLIHFATVQEQAMKLPSVIHWTNCHEHNNGLT